MITETLRAELREIASRYPEARSAMLPCLHAVQAAEGRITNEGIAAVAEVVGAKPDEVESVVSFYSMYSTKPQGKYVIKVCTSVSCYLRGSDDILARLQEKLGIARGETSADGRFTIDMIECLAACGMAPALQVNGQFVECLTPERADLLLERLSHDEALGDLASTWRLTTEGTFTTAPDSKGRDS